MSVINQLASSLGRRDEEPNTALAIAIVAANNKAAVAELVQNLSHKNKDISGDCIKALYEIGERKPALLADYSQTFVELLTHKSNRLQWGAMAALSSITPVIPASIYKALPAIIAAADDGSVITKDNAVNILISLCKEKKYAADAFALLIEQLQKSPTNQLPMYAERAMPIVDAAHKDLFVKTLATRLDEIEKESKRKRVEKVISKLSR